VILVAETTSTPVARLPPNQTSRTPVKRMPVRVTVVPPATGPEAGLTCLTTERVAANAELGEATAITNIATKARPSTPTPNLSLL
jgi:hypothetical protein